MRNVRKNAFRTAAILAAVMVAFLAGMVGCTANPLTGVKGPGGVGPAAPTNTSGLSSFSFSSFNAFGAGTYSVTVVRTPDGTAEVSYDIFGYDELEGVTCPAEASLLEQLEKIYQDQHIASWNGFDKVDTDVLDGGGFSLSMKFNDGAELSAHGSNVYPQDFGKFEDAVEAVLEPYREEILEDARQKAISQGTQGDLDSIMVTFTQHGTAGSDEYSFFILPEGARDKNFDVIINSAGEYFPAGKLHYYCALPNDAIWFDRVQELIDRHHVMEWHRWNKAADDYNNAEWFQLAFSYSEDGYIDAMGTLHPEGYDAFRADFLQLMADMVKNAEENYGLEQYK